MRIDTHLYLIRARHTRLLAAIRRGDADAAKRAAIFQVRDARELGLHRHAEALKVRES